MSRFTIYRGSALPGAVDLGNGRWSLQHEHTDAAVQAIVAVGRVEMSGPVEHEPLEVAAARWLDTPPGRRGAFAALPAAHQDAVLQHARGRGRGRLHQIAGELGGGPGGGR